MFSSVLGEHSYNGTRYPYCVPVLLRVQCGGPDNGQETTKTQVQVTGTGRTGDVGPDRLGGSAPMLALPRRDMWSESEPVA